MTVGIGGAGSKLSASLDPNNLIVNVSEVELDKVRAAEKLLAVLHSERGQRRGCRKDPDIAKRSFQSVRNHLLQRIRGDLVLASTGGGTGNGICSMLLDELAIMDNLDPEERPRFAFLLPAPDREPAEYVKNTISFLSGPLSSAMDTGNTGNIFLFSNTEKYRSRLTEGAFNDGLVTALEQLLSIPERGEALKLLEGHIDHEDFELFLSKPYFNWFTSFEIPDEQSFEEALEANPNPFLLPHDAPIEAMFFLEIPAGGPETLFFEVLDYFARFDLVPVHSVAENPELKTPRITLSMLYSRKPDQLVRDLERISVNHDQLKIRRSLDQQVTLTPKVLDLAEETRKTGEKVGKSEEDILSVLRRIGKLG